MDNIVAAEFRDFASAEAAMEALEVEGIAPSQMTSFYLNAPGQHGTFPIGGDQDEDPEAKGAGVTAAQGAMLGGAAGLALGLAATPLVGPLAVAGALAAGAYTGSLAGAVGGMGNGHAADETQGEMQRDPLVRPAGVVVAVHAPTTFDRDRATAVLRRHQANSIEVAEGTWKEGTWFDFDPVSIPKWRKAPERPH
jgi:hypothetical protein